MRYGALPEDLGPLDLPTSEMLYWLYCPVSSPGYGLFLPDTLEQFRPLLEFIWPQEGALFRDSYVYLTAKTLWVSGDNPGNRPGWHTDGFGTNDLNYIWYDRAPTEFYADDFELPPNCADAMAVMTERAEGAQIVTYPERHVLRLTPSVVHRVPAKFASGMRTFFKVSISPDRYNLIGNSINHRLPERWPLVARQAERNHPASP
jgi:hypothetical protein